MAQMKCPPSVSSITVSGNVLTPDGNGLVTATDADVTIATDVLTCAFLVSADKTTGAITLRLPPNIGAVTINSVAYTPDGNRFIVVPAADATAFLYIGLQLVTG